MHKLELEINDKIYAKILQFLQSFSQQDLTITKLNQQPEENLVEFFQNSPLVGEVDLKRSKEVYEQRFKL